MTQLQPDIMIVNGFDQDGCDPGAIAPQHIGKDLIAGQRSSLRRNAESIQALTDPLGERLLRMGNAGNAILLTELPDTIPLAIGNHANLDVGTYHVTQPFFHSLRRNIGGIRNDGIIKIQHQQFNATTFQQFRCDLGQVGQDDLGKQRKGHIHTHPFINI